MMPDPFNFQFSPGMKEYLRINEENTAARDALIAKNQQEAANAVNQPGTGEGGKFREANLIRHPPGSSPYAVPYDNDLSANFVDGRFSPKGFTGQIPKFEDWIGSLTQADWQQIGGMPTQAPSINPEQFTTQTPHQLNKVASEGYGQPWIRAMFGMQTEDLGTRFARERDISMANLASSGFSASGAIMQDIQESYGTYAKSAQDILSGIEQKNQSVTNSTQDWLGQLAVQNARQSAETSSFNEQQGLKLYEARGTAEQNFGDFLTKYKQSQADTQSDIGYQSAAEELKRLQFEKQLEYYESSAKRQVAAAEGNKSGILDWLGIGLQAGSMIFAPELAPVIVPGVEAAKKLTNDNGG